MRIQLQCNNAGSWKTVAKSINPAMLEEVRAAVLTLARAAIPYPTDFRLVDAEDVEPHPSGRILAYTDGYWDHASWVTR